MPQGPLRQILMPPPVQSGPPVQLDQTPLAQTNPGLARLVDFFGGLTGLKDALVPDSSNATVAGAGLGAALPLMGVLGSLKKIGQPISAYHGSPRTDLTRFNPEAVSIPRKAESSALGTFFTKEEQAAKHYAGGTGKVYSGDISGNLYPLSRDEFVKIGSRDEFRALREKLQAQGFDGVEIPHLNEIAVWNEQAMQMKPAPITAYHGSPHDFDKFSLSKIGTGEGAQAYGHGLYFAENPNVAEDYRRTLAAPTKESPRWRLRGEPVAPGTDHYRLAGVLENSPPKDGEPIAAYLARRAKELDDHAAFAERVYGPDSAEMYKSQAAMVKKIKPEELQLQKPGKTYEVGLHASPDEFLDWDKPLSQQSEKVQKAIRSIPMSNKGMEVLNSDPTGATLHDLIEDYGRKTAEASEKLKGLGIKGIRYLDQGSRGTHSVVKRDGDWGILQPDGNLSPFRFADKGQAEAKAAWFDDKARTSNFVVFDDDIIEIKKKLALLLAAGAGTAAATQKDRK